MINRIILLVIDGFGIGALPDGADYGDADANTLAHLADTVDGLSLPNFEMLGLGHVAQIKGVRTMGQPSGSFGRLAFASPGKDSTVGYWEIGGVIQSDVRTVCSSGVPAKIVDIVEQILGRKSIGKSVSSMEVMLRRHGREHMATGSPMLWSDGGIPVFWPCMSQSWHHWTSISDVEKFGNRRKIQVFSFVSLLSRSPVGTIGFVRTSDGKTL